MRTLKARVLLGFPVSELWDILTGPIRLIFDNGDEVDTNAREILYSLFAWEFIRQFPKVELKKSHLVTSVLGGKLLNPETHLKLIGNVLFDTYDTYVHDWQAHLPTGTIPEVQFRDQLARMAYRITNDLYNETSHRCEEYVASFDLTDYMKLLAHPRVREVNNKMESEGKTRGEIQKLIDENYRVNRDVILNAPETANNPLCRAARSKTVKFEQLLQAIGVRGFLTDIDSRVLENAPILRGFARGLRSTQDLFVESRSAAKSLAFTDKPLQDAEYFSRRLQLVSLIVQNLHFMDCGSTNYLIVKVRGETLDHLGNVIRPGDIERFEGKYYMDDDGKLKVIRAKDRHLIGRTLKLREVKGCMHPDPNGFCAVCFGELFMSVPENSNIGHFCCSHIGQKSSQLVMSVKHHDGSSVVEGVVLDDYQRQYLRSSPDGMSYLMSEQLKGASVQLIVDPESASGLTDIMDVDVVHKLHLSRVSEMKTIGMRVEFPNGKAPRSLITGSVPGLDVGDNRRPASFTYEMLSYIREQYSNGWVIDAPTGCYMIDMANWDWTKPILTLPLRHYNMSDHSEAVASMLESSVDEMEKRDKHVEPSALLMDFYDLVNSRLFVNLAICEVVIYGAMIVSAENRDYRLPKPWTPSGLGVMSKTMFYRSKGASMAYQGHRQLLTEPESYNIKIVPDHPFDGILMPAEVFGTPDDSEVWKDYQDSKREMMNQ